MHVQLPSLGILAYKDMGWGVGGQNTFHIKKSTLINILVKGGIDKKERIFFYFPCLCNNMY